MDGDVKESSVKYEKHSEYMKRRMQEEEQNRHIDYELPYLRAKIASQQTEIELLKRDMKELTECFYKLIKRYEKNS